MNDVWTEERDAELLRLRLEEKLPMDVVAERIGRAVDVCYARVYKLTDVRNQPKDPLDEAGRDRMRNLFARGMSASEIACEIGRDVTAVQYYLGELGLSRGRTKPWNDEDDALVRALDLADDVEAALDAVCSETGRLRRQVVLRRATLSKASVKEAARQEADSKRRVELEAKRKAKDSLKDSKSSTTRRADPRPEDDPAVVSTIVDRSKAGERGVDVAADLGLSYDLVRRIAKSAGHPFLSAWTREDEDLLRRLALSCATQAEIADEAGSLLEGRSRAAIMARVRSLRIVPGRVRVRPPAVRRASSPSAHGADTRRNSVPVRSPPAVAGSDMERMMAEFAASGRSVVRCDVDRTDGVDGLVTALRRRGYAVVGDGKGWKVDRTRIENLKALARFASARGIDTSGVGV